MLFLHAFFELPHALSGENTDDVRFSHFSFIESDQSLCFRSIFGSDLYTCTSARTQVVPGTIERCLHRGSVDAVTLVSPYR